MQQAPAHPAIYSPARRYEIGRVLCFYCLDAWDRLALLEADGLVTRTPQGVHVRLAGRLLIRNVAMAFDAYWAHNEHPAHAQTV